MSKVDTEIRQAIKTLQKILEQRKRHNKAVGRAWEDYICDETARNGGKRPSWLKKRR